MPAARGPRPLVAARSVRRLIAVSWLLVSVDFLDELASGVPGVGADGIQRSFEASHTAMGALLTAFGLLALVVEPPLFFLADRYPRRLFVCGGLFGLGVSCFVAALAPNYGWLFFALLLFGPLSGCGVSLSQATLVDARPEDAERWLMRWTLAGGLGDLATPGLLALMALLGWGWRGAFVVCGIYAVVQSLTLWRTRFPDEVASASEETEPAPPWRDALREALRNRSLLAWAMAVAACTLLDEILVIFATLRLRREALLSDQQTFLVIATLSAGAAFSLLFADRLHGRVPPVTLLRVVCVVGLIAHVLFVCSDSLPLLLPLALLSGACIGLQYPLAKAQLYRALPGRSGTAIATAGLFGPVELVLPIAIGLVADTWGLRAALLILALQPLLLLVISLRSSTDVPAPAALS